MSKKSKKHQQAIATATIEQQERRKLLRQIRTLKRLPDDFRDIDPGSNDWEAFADITGRRKEMTDWSNGPVIYFGALNKFEKMILGRPNRLIKVIGCLGRDNGLTTMNHFEIIQLAERQRASWLYLPDEVGTVIDALNVLFSRFGYNVRARGQVKSERTGKPIGVVH